MFLRGSVVFVKQPVNMFLLWETGLKATGWNLGDIIMVTRPKTMTSINPRVKCLWWATPWKPAVASIHVYSHQVVSGCWLSLGENGLQREGSTQKPPCDWFGCHGCVEDNNLSANIHTEQSGRERQTGNSFRVKVVPYYWKHHISKGATFTLKVSGLCCTFPFALPLVGRVLAGRAVTSQLGATACQTNHKEACRCLPVPRSSLPTSSNLSVG